MRVSGFQERRRQPRFGFPRTATVQRGPGRQAVILRDLSLSGLRVDLRARRSLGSRFRFTLRENGKDAGVVLETSVCRIDPDGGAFLRFQELDSDALMALGRVFSTLR